MCFAQLCMDALLGEAVLAGTVVCAHFAVLNNADKRGCRIHNLGRYLGGMCDIINVATACILCGGFVPYL